MKIKGGTKTEIQYTKTSQQSPSEFSSFSGIGNVLGNESSVSDDYDPLFKFLNDHTHSIESIILHNFKND